MTAILTIQDLEKSFGPRRVLRGISFAVEERDRVGLIGINGSGKSTLMKMVVAGAIGGAGVGADEAAGLEPDAGRVTWRRDLRLEYVAQEPRFDPDDTVARCLDRGPELAPHEIQSLAGSLQLPAASARLDELSIGQRRRVAIARALLGRADLLALDEPTNHLDARTVEWLEEFLRERAGALLLVTHDRYFLDRVATRIVEIDRGRAYSYEGGYSEFLEKQAARLDTEQSHEHERMSFVRRELSWIRRRPKARTTKAKARIDRFDDAVAAAPTADDQVAGGMSLTLPSGGRLGGTILEIDQISRSIDGRTLFDSLSLVMKPGDRIGIVGPNGAGKTTLLRTLLGLAAPDRGRVVVGHNTQFSYLEQGRSELREDLTVLEEVADGNDFVLLESGPIHVRSFLKMLHFSETTAGTKIRLLSGGERNRVQLARLLRRGGNLIVLDEPTNDLDLMTLGALEQALVRFPGCALVVSHDRWFLDRVATGILAFEDDGVVTFYEGDYSSYQARRSARLEAEARSRTASAAPTAPAPQASREARAAGPRKLTFKERNELATIEETIAAAEAKVRELEAASCDPSLFKDRGAEVPRLLRDLELARAEVDHLYQRWQQLDELARQQL